MPQEPFETSEKCFNEESIRLVEKLVDDFAHLLARYSKPIEARGELEKGEIAAELCMLLEHFYEPVDHTNDLTDEEFESLNERLGFDVRDKEQLRQWWQGHIDVEREKIKRLDEQRRGNERHKAEI